MKISVSVSVADMLVLIYRYQYRQNYNVIYMYGWTDISPTLAGMRMGLRNSNRGIPNNRNLPIMSIGTFGNWKMGNFRAFKTPRTREF